MNTVKKGAAYEAAFREHYERCVEAEGLDLEVKWQPPRPRAHSTGYDAMSWILGVVDDGITLQTEPTLWEFKAGRMSCARAARLRTALDGTRPAFVHVAVVHRTRTAEFCEH